MKIKYKLLLPLFLLGAVSVSYAMPSQFQAEYSVTTDNGMPLGKAKRNYQVDEDGNYLFTSTVKATGLAALFMGTVEESSRGEVSPKGFKPKEYHYKRSGKKKRENLLAFDWDKKQLQHKLEKGKVSELPVSALDKLSFQVAIMQELASDSAKQEIEYSVMDRRGLRIYKLQNQGKENISTKHGDYDAIHLQRDNKKRKFSVWCAEELGYLPVLIQYTEKNGMTYQMQLTSLSMPK